MKNSTVLNPWATIWLNPRATIRQIVDTDPKRAVRLLAAGGGIAQACSFAVNTAIGRAVEPYELFVFILFFGPLAGFFSLFLWTVALSAVSRWFGGSADRPAMQAAVAWSWAPTVYLLPLWGVRYILFREEMFTDSRPFIESHRLLSALYSFFGGFDFLLSVLTIYILIQTVSEVSRISTTKSIGSILSVLILITIPVIVLMLILAKF